MKFPAGAELGNGGEEGKSRAAWSLNILELPFSEKNNPELIL